MKIQSQFVNGWEGDDLLYVGGGTNQILVGKVKISSIYQPPAKRLLSLLMKRISIQTMVKPISRQSSVW